MEQKDKRDAYAGSVIAFGTGVKHLKSLMDWIETGSSSIEDLHVDRGSLDKAIQDLEQSLVKLQEGESSGRLLWWPPIRDEDIERVRRVRVLIMHLLDSGTVPPDLGQLIEQCLVASLGADWRMAFVKQSISQTTDDSIKLDEWLDAFHNGLNCLAAIVLWSESVVTSVDGLEIDRSSLERLERSMIELRDGVATGRMEGGPPIRDEDIESVRRLRTMLNDGGEIGDISPDVGELSEKILTATWGPTWRDEYR